MFSLEINSLQCQSSSPKITWDSLGPCERPPLLPPEDAVRPEAEHDAPHLHRVGARHHVHQEAWDSVTSDIRDSVSSTLDEEQPGRLTRSFKRAEVGDVGGISRGKHQIWRVWVAASLELDPPQVGGHGLTGARPAKVNLEKG